LNRADCSGHTVYVLWILAYVDSRLATGLSELENCIFFFFFLWPVAGESDRILNAKLLTPKADHL
jgi:hypothetical protein